MSQNRLLLSRADLLRAIHLGNNDLTAEDRYAGLLDYVRKADAGETSEIRLRFEPADRASNALQAPPAIKPSPAPLQAVYSAITACSVLDTPDQSGESTPVRTGEPLSKAQCEPRADGEAPFLPLVRPTRLWPALRRSLSVPHHGNLDLRRMLATVTRGQPLSRLPRLARTGWSEALTVVLDNSERLIPYRDDYEMLLREIIMRRGAVGVQVVIVAHEPSCLDRAMALPDWHLENFAGKNVPFIYAGNRVPMPVHGTQVLLLTDLGFISDAPAIAAQWRCVIAQLCQAGAKPVAWIPCSGRLVETATSRLTQIYALDPAKALRPQRGQLQAGERRSAVHRHLGELRERLLMRLACCVSVQPNVLRAMRLAFADTAAEPALEGIVWGYQPVVRSSAVSRPLAPDHQMQYRNAFAQLPPAEQGAVLDCMRYWHSWEGRSTEVFETLIWASHVRPEAAAIEQVIRTEAEQWFDAFSMTMDRYHATDSDLRRFAAALLERNFSDAVWMRRYSATLSRMWALSGRPEVPRGLHAADIACARNRLSSMPDANYHLWQIGTELWLWPEGMQKPARTISRFGSPIRATGLYVEWPDGHGRWIDFDGKPVRVCDFTDLGGEVALTVRDRRHVVTCLNRPVWATECGRDRYGLYADFTIETKHGRATQRLRWIEPGTFRMGSPTDESERFDSEGPQHPVTLTRGYWLADTACTQALWQAVTGKNLSRFKDDAQNPVENVSWNDVQPFLRALEALLPGVEACLPTEAQWEYACRAGTTTPYSSGMKISQQQVNFSSKQSRTVPVKSLPANAWGLYEMHGNVLEWCADDLRTYDATPQQDPEGPADGPRRALRGGSWHDDARIARSAFRGGIDPGDRYGTLGFRLCLRSSSPVRPGGPGQARRPEGDMPAGPARDVPAPSLVQRATEFFSRSDKPGGHKKS